MLKATFLSTSNSRLNKRIIVTVSSSVCFSSSCYLCSAVNSQFCCVINFFINKLFCWTNRELWKFLWMNVFQLIERVLIDQLKVWLKRAEVRAAMVQKREYGSVIISTHIYYLDPKNHVPLRLVLKTMDFTWSKSRQSKSLWKHSFSFNWSRCFWRTFSFPFSRRLRRIVRLRYYLFMMSKQISEWNGNYTVLHITFRYKTDM